MGGTLGKHDFAEMSENDIWRKERELKITEYLDTLKSHSPDDNGIRDLCSNCYVPETFKIGRNLEKLCRKWGI